jgi:hypothetical protein
MRQDGDSQGTGRQTHSVNDDAFSVIPRLYESVSICREQAAPIVMQSYHPG